VGWRHTTFADLSPVIANPPPIARLDTPSQSHFYWRIEGTILSLKTLITVPSISPFPLDIQHGIYILCTCVAVGWLHRLLKYPHSFTPSHPTVIWLTTLSGSTTEPDLQM